MSKPKSMVVESGGSAALLDLVTAETPPAPPPAGAAIFLKALSPAPLEEIQLDEDDDGNPT